MAQGDLKTLYEPSVAMWVPWRNHLIAYHVACLRTLAGREGKRERRYLPDHNHALRYTTPLLPSHRQAPWWLGHPTLHASYRTPGHPVIAVNHPWHRVNDDGVHVVLGSTLPGATALRVAGHTLVETPTGERYLLQ